LELLLKLSRFFEKSGGACLGQNRFDRGAENVDELIEERKVRVREA
jgi:hypothetical protein